MEKSKMQNRVLALVVAMMVTVAMMPILTGVGTAHAATNQVSINTKVSGKLSTSRGSMYQFSIPQKGRIQMQFWHNKNGDHSFDYMIYRVKADGTLEDLHFSGYGSGISGDLTVNDDYLYTGSHCRIPGGIYYVKFWNPFGYCSEPYSFKVNYVQEGRGYESEWNDTPAQANLINLNTKYIGNASDLHQRSDYDWFKVQVKKSGYIYPKVRVGMGQWQTRFELMLYKQKNDGTLSLIERESFWDKGSWCGTKSKVTKGTYFIEIQDGMDSTDYQFTLLSDTTFGKPAITVKSGKKSAKISWKKVIGTSGYQIYRATTKKGSYKKIKTITKQSTTSFKNKKLKKGKRYYYKVRAYKTVNGKKVYSGFSSAKSVKVK